MIATTLDEVRKSLFSLPKGSLIFLDVDDTLITPSSRVFHAQSPYRMFIDELKKERERYANFDHILSTWRLQRQPMLVAEDWPTLMRDLCQRHNVYGLTKMESGKFGYIPSMEKWRYEELTKLGLVFTPFFSGKEDCLMIQEQSRSLCPAVFYKGIFITGSYSKGDVLKAFPQDLEFPYIVLVDEREEYLDQLRNFCEQKGIRFLGVLFKGMELILGKPDPAVAEFQKAHLLEYCEWLDDEVASEYVRSHQKSPHSFD